MQGAVGRGRSALVAIVLALVALTLATGGSGEATDSPTLRTAFSTDPSPLDPDTYYESEGEEVISQAYQGLLRYKPDSPQIEGLLATSWTKSSDGLTYTFKLRKGVRFSDGTPFNAAAAKASLERRTALNGGPSYMLADVKSYSTPNQHTLVVHLDKPVAPFLDYLASMFGPMMTSPTAVAMHRKGGDHAHGWLAFHTAGTGPYVLSTVQHGVRYALTPNTYYWGAKPYFKTVNIAVIPDFTTQLEELEGGQLDIVLHGLTTKTVEGLSHNSSVEVKEFPALRQAEVWINPKSTVFSHPKVRAALRAALDNKALTAQIWGPRATPSTNVYPAGMLPNGVAPDVHPYKPSLLGPALASFKGAKVTIGWAEETTNENLASQLQVVLDAHGLNANVQQFPPDEFYSLPAHPKLRPDLVVIGFNPDAVAPDTFARIYWYHNAPVNLLGCAVPKADKLLDKAARQASARASQAFGAQAAIAYRDSNCWLNIADVRDTVVMRKGLTGSDLHQLEWLFMVNVARLREG
jgi:peptide/nickel transport system substrate-binding protein